MLEILNMSPLCDEEGEEYQDLNAFFRQCAAEEGCENIEQVQFSNMIDVRLFP